MSASGETTTARAVGNARLASLGTAAPVQSVLRSEDPGVGATAGVPQTLYPVVRIGQLVRATNAKTGKARALSFDQAQTALARLQSRADETLDAIQAAMIAAVRAAGDEIVLIDEQTDDLAGAGPARGLGVIFNYHEFAVALNGAVIVVRNAVTLCITPAQDILEAQDNELPCSKAWTRFNLLTHPDSREAGHRAANLGAEPLRIFEAQCQVMAKAALEALGGIYREVLEAAMGEELNLDTHSQGDFSVLTLGLSGGDSPALFEAARSGQGFTAQVQQGTQAARRFAELALPALQGKDLKLEEALAKFRADDACKYIRFETPDADEGLYVACFKGNSARFVGVAHDQREVTNGDSVVELADAAHLSANVVSAGLITRFARNL